MFSIFKNKPKVEVFCVNCTHFLDEQLAYFKSSGRRCTRLGSVVDPVMGPNAEINLLFCSLERQHTNTNNCGPEGKFYQAKN